MTKRAKKWPKNSQKLTKKAKNGNFYPRKMYWILVSRIDTSHISEEDILVNGSCLGWRRDSQLCSHFTNTDDLFECSLRMTIGSIEWNPWCFYDQHPFLSHVSMQGFYIDVSWNNMSLSKFSSNWSTRMWSPILLPGDLYLTLKKSNTDFVRFEITKVWHIQHQFPHVGIVWMNHSYSTMVLLTGILISFKSISSSRWFPGYKIQRMRDFLSKGERKRCEGQWRKNTCLNRKSSTGHLSWSVLSMRLFHSDSLGEFLSKSFSCTSNQTQHSPLRDLIWFDSSTACGEN